MAIVDNSGTGLAALGRNEDRFMAHVAPGEMVVPPVISDKTRSIIRKEMAAVGLDPNEYVVGQGMSINPITGQAEFGFLKKIAKSVKKVVKKVAPIAAVIPGPWQPFAAVYQKGNAALKLAKGEGGLGEIMTLAAGGNQALTGKGGAFSKIGKIAEGGGAFTDAVGGGFMDSLGKIGKVEDELGKLVFNPMDYGKNVLAGIASDQQQGYLGAFGGNKGTFDVNTGKFIPFEEGVTAGFNPFASNVKPYTDAEIDVLLETNDPSTVEQMVKERNAASQTFLSKLTGIGDGKTPSFIKSIGDAVGLGGQSGLEDFYGGTGAGGSGTGTGGFGGIDPKMAGLALLYGKVVKDAAKKTEGGLTDIRQSKRPDLNPAPVFAGFDLGIRKKAAFGGPIGFGRQYFNEGGMAVKELDMRQGGESVGPGTGTSDDIPAMLSDGEFVMTAAANNGAGGFKFNKTKKGIELIAASKPNREKGVDVMTNLMETFEKYNKSGSMA